MVVTATSLPAQDTYTNYCPDTPYPIHVTLTFHYLDQRTETVFEQEFTAVKALFESQQLEEYRWAVFFERVIDRDDCFRIRFKKDFKNLLLDRNIRLIELVYLSGKGSRDVVTIRFDVKNDQIASHIKNGDRD